MPITLIPDPGSGSAAPILRAKFNEVIAAINAMQELLTGGAVTQMTWCRYDYAEEEIVGNGSNIASAEVIGSTLRIHFTEPFASADDYCAQFTFSTESGGAVNIDETLRQHTDYVELWVGTDGGGTVMPSAGWANLTITYNASL